MSNTLSHPYYSLITSIINYWSSPSATLYVHKIVNIQFPRWELDLCVTHFIYPVVTHLVGDILNSNVDSLLSFINWIDHFRQKGTCLIAGYYLRELIV